MPTGGEPPLAHTSGYKSGSLSRVQAKVAVPQNRFGGSKGYRDRAVAPRGQQPGFFFVPNLIFTTKDDMAERCAVCNCVLHRTAGTYARPTLKGRSHATKHHFVAERFFGRSANRKGTLTKGVFRTCPWGHEEKTAVFCYECHEELLHNPVLLPEDVERFASLVKQRGLSEERKTSDRSKLGGRILLLHEVLARGLQALAQEIEDCHS